MGFYLKTPVLVQPAFSKVRAKAKPIISKTPVLVQSAFTKVRAKTKPIISKALFLAQPAFTAIPMNESAFKQAPPTSAGSALSRGAMRKRQVGA